MFFFPFRLDISLPRLPWLVILISLACIVVFVAQQRSEKRIELALEQFCQPQHDRQLYTTMVVLHIPPTARTCRALMASILASDDQRAFILRLVDRVIRHPGALFRDRPLMQWLVLDTWSRFQRLVPDGYLTSRLWYRPIRIDPVRMITAAFAHGSWSHLLGNLAFFLIFASALEIILGSWRFLLVVISLALGTHLFYFLFSHMRGDPTPTIGLSGVVMGVMAMMAWFLPRVRVRCLLWFLFIVRIVLVPAWLFVGWYIGWDAWRLFSGADSGGVNLVAHVSGGMLGVLLGQWFFQERRRRLRLEYSA